MQILSHTQPHDAPLKTIFHDLSNNRTIDHPPTAEEPTTRSLVEFVLKNTTSRISALPSPNSPAREPKVNGVIYHHLDRETCPSSPLALKRLPHERRSMALSCQGGIRCMFYHSLTVVVKRLLSSPPPGSGTQ